MFFLPGICVFVWAGVHSNLRLSSHNLRVGPGKVGSGRADSGLRNRLYITDCGPEFAEKLLQLETRY